MIRIRKHKEDLAPDNNKEELRLEEQKIQNILSTFKNYKQVL